MFKDNTIKTDFFPINKMIIADYFVFGKTQKDLAQKYNYSIKNIEKIISNPEIVYIKSGNCKKN